MKIILRLFFAFLAISSSWTQASELPIVGLAHVAFQSSSLERTRVFYTGFTGYEYAFSVTEEQPAWYLKVNDDQFIKLVLAPTPSKIQDDKLIEIALQVTDAKKTFSLLNSKGLKPTKIKKRKDGTLATTIKDPDNHIIAFVEYTKNSLQQKSKGKYLGQRRIANRMWRASFIVSNEAKSQDFYTKKLGFKEEWHGISAHDNASKSAF
ncbi:VOC family protein [Vibrio artabrorum]|uniref:VOC family protein n=2 Tax=Vibrio artabrorum TaxID=446374 RepID=A0ABT8CKP1_9VIBR|nr:VOC family protein [Vibrio artabrorum]MDN3702307.1 VOC family protein [Vibrio artabrorum]